MNKNSNMKMKGVDMTESIRSVVADADMDGVVDATENLGVQADQYADQLAAKEPGRLYVVMDERRQKVYQR